MDSYIGVHGDQEQFFKATLCLNRTYFVKCSGPQAQKMLRTVLWTAVEQQRFTWDLA